MVVKVLRVEKSGHEEGIVTLVLLRLYLSHVCMSSWPKCAVIIRAVRPYDRRAIRLGGGGGIVVKKRANTDGGKRKRIIFGWDCCVSKVEGVRLGNFEHAFRSCLVGDCVLACVRKVTHCWHCCWRFAKKVTHCWHRCSHCVRRSLFKPFRRII